jgi:diaminopropionate ammonia-lyase
MQLIANRSQKRNAPLSETERQIVGTKAPAKVRKYLPAFPAYEPTSLTLLPNLAKRLRIGGLALKNEGERYGLSSFKALGGAYAVAHLVRDYVETKLGRRIAPAQLLEGESKSAARDLTVCCATDGNHGRSVAAGAQMFGCKCVIFVHDHVSSARAASIAELGAEVRRTDGSYDQSVVQARAVAKEEGWLTVSDFSWEGYRDIPSRVMQGYSIMLDEIVRQSTAPYSHVFVQGGVGGLAAVVGGYLLDLYHTDRPVVIVVEPSSANCLQISAANNSRTKIEPGQSTMMAMLECYEPSLVAWQILEKCADFYLDVPDGQAIAALKQLARPIAGDASLRIGESGAAGLAGLIAVADDPLLRQTLELDVRSNMLLFGTEGATDPELYSELLNSDSNRDITACQFAG